VPKTSDFGKDVSIFEFPDSRCVPSVEGALCRATDGRRLELCMHGRIVLSLGVQGAAHKKESKGPLSNNSSSSKQATRSAGNEKTVLSRTNRNGKLPTREQSRQ
jgi:hypothetical protein